MKGVVERAAGVARKGKSRSVSQLLIQLFIRMLYLCYNGESEVERAQTKPSRSRGRGLGEGRFGSRWEGVSGGDCKLKKERPIRQPTFVD